MVGGACARRGCTAREDSMVGGECVGRGCMMREDSVVMIVEEKHEW